MRAVGKSELADAGQQAGANRGGLGQADQPRYRAKTFKTLVARTQIVDLPFAHKL